MALGAARSRGAAADFLFLAAAGHHGLLPLLHQPREWPIKVPPQAGVPTQAAQRHPCSLLTPWLDDTRAHGRAHGGCLQNVYVGGYHMPRVA